MATPSPAELALMAMTSMAIFCDTFVLLVVFLTFRRHTGLYFWALIGTAFAQIAVCISTYLSFWALGGRLPSLPVVLTSAGNAVYVVSDFLVLYSRLHLLGASSRHLRLILGTIIAEWCLVEMPLVLLNIYSGLDPDKLLVAEVLAKWWDVEAVLYVLVDCSLSAMYFFLIKRMWDEEGAWRRVHWNVIAMIVLILCIDGTYLLFVFSSENNVTLGIVLLAFSLKIPIEIYALNMLTEMSRSQVNSAQLGFSLVCDSETQGSPGTEHATMTTTKTAKSEK